MKKKFKSTKFIARLLLVLVVIAAVIVGGYFLLDKSIVPKYFSEYGINSMNDLVGTMRTLYGLPSEKEIIENGYKEVDLTSATTKLIDKGYPILEDGTFDFESFDEGKRGNGDLNLTDRELCAVIDKLLDSTEFSDILPNLNYMNTININLLELTITPEETDETTNVISVAHLKFILKVDTSEVRNFMAQEMDIPVFLLNMIFPSTLYLTANYNVKVDNSGDSSVWETSDGLLSVNGSTAEQSEIFLNLLISFIFDSSEEMTIEKLLSNLGDIIDQGVELFGEIEFVTGLGTVSKTQNGIYFLPVETTE